MAIDKIKWEEPDYLANQTARPIPEPVLAYQDVHNADDSGYLWVGDNGDQNTPDGPGLDSVARAFYPYFWGDFFNRVYVIPTGLTLTDPVVGFANKFYFFNANFVDATLTAIDEPMGSGLEIDFTTGLEIGSFRLSEVHLTVTPAAPQAENVSYLFSFDTGSDSPFRVILTRTNLLTQAPEQPLGVTYSWKSDVAITRDGTEQRSSIRQLNRVSYRMSVIFDTDASARIIYRQFFSKGGNPFSVPVWEEPMKLLSDASLGDTVIDIDLSRYDVRDEDQLYFLRGDETFELATVQATGSNTVTLYSALNQDFKATWALYRVTTVYLPSQPKLDRGPITTDTDLTLAVVNARSLFTGTVTTVAVTKYQIFQDRIISNVVYTLGDCPVIHARPLAQDKVSDTFDWNFEVIDFDTGAFQQTTTRTTAAVSYTRQYYVRYYYQEHFFNYCFNWMHGQRQPVWIPTWQSELTDEVVSASADTIILNNLLYAAEFDQTTSHRGLWIKYRGGYLPRQVTDVYVSGVNTTIKITPALPEDFPLAGPYDIGFLVLCRLGNDEVQIDRFSFYSMFNMTFTSTFSTSTGA